MCQWTALLTQGATLSTCLNWGSPPPKTILTLIAHYGTLVNYCLSLWAIVLVIGVNDLYISNLENSA